MSRIKVDVKTNAIYNTVLVCLKKYEKNKKVEKFEFTRTAGGEVDVLVKFPGLSERKKISFREGYGTKDVNEIVARVGGFEEKPAALAA